MGDKTLPTEKASGASLLQLQYAAEHCHEEGQYLRTTFWHNELQTSVEKLLKAHAAGFYDKDIGKLVPRYEKCLRRSVDYEDK